MKSKTKLFLTAFVLLFIIFMGLSLPLIPTSTGEECGNSICSTVTYYHSFFDQAFPCTFNVCSGAVKTITLSSAVLYGGHSATNSSGATAALWFSLNNPGSKTRIMSIMLTGPGVTATTSADHNGTQLGTAGNGTIIVFRSGAGINLTITDWDNSSQPSTPSNSENFAGVQIPSGTVSSFIFYPASSVIQQIRNGWVYSYVINFANDQWISGSLIAQ